jgi:hypothetical protein
VVAVKPWRAEQVDDEQHPGDLTRYALDTLIKARQKFGYACDDREAYLTAPFCWAAFLKSHPDLAGLDGWQAAERVEALFPALLEADLQDPDPEERERRTGDPWVDLLFDHDNFDGDADPQATFIESWGKAQPWKPSPWHVAQERARRAPLTPPQPRPASYVAVVSLCYRLSEAVDYQSFVLSSRQAGAFAGITQSLAARWLRLAVRDGLITLEAGGSLGRRQAATYRWSGEVAT